MSVTALGTSQKGRHIVLGFLWLASVTWVTVFKFPPCCGTCQNFLPLHGWGVVRCPLGGYLCARVLLVRSSAGELLGCFHLLVVTNNAVNLGVEPLCLLNTGFQQMVSVARNCRLYPIMQNFVLSMMSGLTFPQLSDGQTMGRLNCGHL